MSFDNLGLSARILDAVRAMGYSAPTPIQEQAIPAVLAGNDVVGCAQTGTGKTAAFTLPLLDRVAAGNKAPRALVVTPTRELAAQIEGVARAASKFTKHRVACVYGGVGYQPQAQAMRRGVDVLVATPGRLLDLVGNRHADLSKIEVLVLDEADRMLDMGFLPDVKRILALLPKNRQNLLFSATMTPEVMRVAGDTLHDPVRVDVAPPSKPIDRIAQSVYPVGSQQKVDLLLRLISDHQLERVLVFTRTKHRADKVAKILSRSGIRGAAIHGNRSQSQRQEALDGFKRGRHRVLVATDIVARGIDVEEISHVINFDLPNVPEDYVHRIGRTARAGKSGTAYSLVSPEEHDQLRDIEKTIDAVLDCTDHEGFDYKDQRIIPDPEREARPARPQRGGGGERVTPGSGRKGRRGGSARRNRAASGGSSTAATPSHAGGAPAAHASGGTSATASGHGSRAPQGGESRHREQSHGAAHAGGRSARGEGGSGDASRGSYRDAKRDGGRKRRTHDAPRAGGESRTAEQQTAQSTRRVPPRERRSVMPNQSSAPGEGTPLF